MKATINVFLALLVLAMTGSLTACSAFDPNKSASVFAPDTLSFAAQPSAVRPGGVILGDNGSAPGVAVAILTSQGDTDTAATDTVTIAIGANPAGGTLSGKTVVAAVNGQAIFSNLSIDKPGNGYTLVASGGRFNSVSSNPFNIAIPPPVATKLAFTQQPANATAGASITPAIAVTIEDAQGNPVTTATNSVTIAIGTNPAGGTLSGALTANAVAGTGVATFSNLSIDKAGTGYTLTATASGFNAATSNAFNITAPSALGNGPIFTPGSVPALDDAGDTAVIGLSGSNTPSTATVFVNNAGKWSQAAQLQSPTGVQSVAISGDGNTVVIGDCGNNA